METVLDSSKYLELSVREAGREVCVPGKATAFTPKSYHLFHYVVSGRGHLSYNGAEYDIKAGEFFYIAPGDKPTYRPDPKDPWSYEWIGISGSNAARLIHLAGISSEHPVVSDKARDIKRFFDGIYASQSQEKGVFTLEALAFAYGLFARISHPEKTEAHTSAKKAHIAAAKEFIENNYAFAITMEDVAKSVGVSPNYLSNIFKEIEDSSPKRFLIETRMEKAALLILSGQYRVKEVASMVAYPNQLHFSAAFHKYFGVSPSAYKKNPIRKESRN